MNVDDRMRSAYAAHGRGDLNGALTEARAALRSRPNDPRLLQFLGVVCCQAGAAEQGITYLRQAMARGGDGIDNRINLAKALCELGRWGEALSVCTPAEGDSSPELERMRADILKAEGRPGEAVWIYERLVHEKPDDFESWNNLGNARHEMGDTDGAMDAFHRARQISPESSIIYTNLARVLTSKDRYEDACLMLEKAAMLAPNDAAPLVELGRMLTNLDHVEAGLKALGDAARINPKDPKIFVAIGLALMDLSQPSQAERAFKFALQADIKHAAAYLQLGVLFEKGNRLSELGGLIKDAERAGVTGDELTYLRALALNRGGDAEGALSLLPAIGTRAIHPAMLAQFLGQLNDRLGRFDEAWRAFQDMNQEMAVSPLGVSVDRSAYQRDIEGLNARTTAEWFAGWPSNSPPSEPPAPVFLVGFPRSGTTLLDTILMGHSRVHVLEEIPLLETVSRAVGDFEKIGRLEVQEIAGLRRLYFDELEKASPPPTGALVIDKNPLSMIRVPLIHRLFPDAKIILAMRHPCDVVLSCFMQNFKPTEAMASFLDLANASRTYDRIFAYWEKCMTIFPLDVHTLRYEAMVDDVEAATRPLFEFLGLEWEEQALDHRRTAANRGFIRTPSYAQVTEKVYSSASGRWLRYRKYMEEVLPILQPWVARYGYALD